MHSQPHVKIYVSVLITPGSIVVVVDAGLCRNGLPSEVKQGAIEGCTEGRGRWKYRGAACATIVSQAMSAQAMETLLVPVEGLKTDC